MIIFQLYRGTTAQNNAYTGRVGELTADVQLKGLRIHDAVTPGGAQLPNAADKIKLDGIQIGATANASDLFLLDRTNHIGVQAISTISNLQTSLDNKINTNLIGVANGVATLDGNGRVPTGQLPSYVDDVIEVVNFATLPVTGETGKLYLTVDNNYIYRWSGSTYVHINASVGVADTANTLTTSRLINGTAFNGSSDITTSNWGSTRTISFSGDVTGSNTINGSADTSFALTLANSGVTIGTYRSVTVDVKGRVTAGTNPTTLSGYGITDAQPLITLGTTAQYYRGDKTWQTLNTSVVPESGNLYHTGARVLGSVITGFGVGTNTPVIATDTILEAFGKIQGQINARLTTNQSITFTGDATGSGASSVTLTLANSGVSAGTYNNVATQVRPFTVDVKGRVTGIGTAVTITPAWTSITGRPTTISGYGITDAVTTNTTQTITGDKTFSGSVSAPTLGKSVITSGVATGLYVKRSFITESTTGVIDWNDVTNTVPGAGPTLLNGVATNGPEVEGYYHPFNIAYQQADGTGNVTQMAIGYNAKELQLRYRYSSAWSTWVRFLNNENSGIIGLNNGSSNLRIPSINSDIIGVVGGAERMRISTTGTTVTGRVVTNGLFSGVSAITGSYDGNLVGLRSTGNNPIFGIFPTGFTNPYTNIPSAESFSISSALGSSGCTLFRYTTTSADFSAVWNYGYNHGSTSTPTFSFNAFKHDGAGGVQNHANNELIFGIYNRTTNALLVYGNGDVTTPGTITATGGFVGNITGSAATLTTSRTIWGRSFNGSANITGAMTGITTASMSGQLTNTVAVGTAPFVITSTTRVANLNVATAGTADTWTTGRTITIGATGKTVDGSASVSWSTAEIGVVSLTANETITGVKTFRAASAVRVEAAATQDAVVLAGRAGGTTSLAVTLTPTTLTTNRTLTLPDASGTIALTTSNVSTATTLQTTRTIWGQNFNGGANVTGAMSGVTTISMSGQLTNTQATGTAPFVITSTTRVANLNVATAGTADTLTTGRTINGTSFNGSANITTTNWGTSRNLTIGNTSKAVNGSGNVSWSLSEIGAAPSSVVFNNQTVTEYTLALSDAGANVTMTHVEDNTVIIPANSAVAFPIGTIIVVTQLGIGKTTISINTDTLNKAAAFTFSLAQQYSEVVLKKMTSTMWLMSGDLELAP